MKLGTNQNKRIGLHYQGSWSRQHPQPQRDPFRPQTLDVFGTKMAAFCQDDTSRHVVFSSGAAILEISFVEKPLRIWQPFSKGITDLPIHSFRMASASAFFWEPQQKVRNCDSHVPNLFKTGVSSTIVCGILRYYIVQTQ